MKLTQFSSLKHIFPCDNLSTKIIKNARTFKSLGIRNDKQNNSMSKKGRCRLFKQNTEGQLNRTGTKRGNSHFHAEQAAFLQATKCKEKVMRGTFMKVTVYRLFTGWGGAIQCRYSQHQAWVGTSGTAMNTEERCWGRPTSPCSLFQSRAYNLKIIVENQLKSQKEKDIVRRLEMFHIWGG